MNDVAKFSQPLQLEFHESHSGLYFWLYRSADGWIVAESTRTYRNLQLCVSEACEFMLRRFTGY